MHDHFLHEHPQNLVLLGGAGSIPLLLNTFGGGPGRQVGETLRDIFYGLEGLGRFDESGCRECKISLDPV